MSLSSESPLFQKVPIMAEDEPEDVHPVGSVLEVGSLLQILSSNDILPSFKPSLQRLKLIVASGTLLSFLLNLSIGSWMWCWVLQLR
jgi:hypothetical protein